ncbi:MAG: hypothetical protein ACKOCN_02190 [Planctomycetaceae bacterium]
MVSPILPLAAVVSPSLCLIGLVQAFGLCAAVATRLTEGTRIMPAVQGVFMALLAAVGVLCAASFQVGPVASVLSAGTLAVMTLLAVTDFSSQTSESGGSAGS